MRLYNYVHRRRFYAFSEKLLCWPVYLKKSYTLKYATAYELSHILK